MKVRAGRNSRQIAFWALVVITLFFPLSAKGTECSLAKTNRDCSLIINRANPVAPPTVQMYSGQTLTVVIENPLPFERYFLDFTTGQATLTPDVTSSIIQGMLPSLQKPVGVQAQAVGADCSSADFTTVGWPAAGSVTAKLGEFQGCFSYLATKAIKAYQDLEPLVAPDSLTSSAPSPEPAYFIAKRQPILDEIQAYVTSETVISSKISQMAQDKQYQAAGHGPDEVAITQLGDSQKIIDAIAADLLGYSQRLTDLGATGYRTGVHDCGGTPCVSIDSRRDTDQIYQRMVTRTVTYSLDALNLVSYSQEAAPNPTNKKALATVVINFADRPNGKVLGLPFTALRWEASAGVFFSMLPNRSFSVAPVYTGTTITDNTVKENAQRPTPVPFAAANYRLTDDLPGHWKSNIYWTGAVGVNPNTTTADFATGLSFAWRALMVSGLCHFGHDVHLTQGFTNNEDLGPTFTGTVPTHSYWTANFAIGVSVRIPSLSGR